MILGVLRLIVIAIMLGLISAGAVAVSGSTGALSYWLMERLAACAFGRNPTERSSLVAPAIMGIVFAFAAMAFIRMNEVRYIVPFQPSIWLSFVAAGMGGVITFGIDALSPIP